MAATKAALTFHAFILYTKNERFSYTDFVYGNTPLLYPQKCIK